MTWNVWWRFGTDWRRRGDAIEATISACEPDLVGLQEAWGTAELAGLEASRDLFGEAGGPADAVTLSSALPFVPLEAVRRIDRRIDRWAASGHPTMTSSLSTSTRRPRT